LTNQSKTDKSPVRMVSSGCSRCVFCIACLLMPLVLHGFRRTTRGLVPVLKVAYNINKIDGPQQLYESNTTKRNTI
jgi:hypothetical protein